MGLNKTLLIVLFLISTFGFSSNVFADYATSLNVRQQIEWTGGSLDQVVTKKLRTTKGFDQGGSEFCWVFATLNMLETNYLEDNPAVAPEEIELDRWHFTRATKSKMRRGTVVDALYFYSPQIGLATTTYTGGENPSTVFRGQQISPHALRDTMINNQKFWSYAFSNAISGWSQHPDSDALKGTQSFYVSPSKKADILERALKMNKAVAISISGHGLVIYGADFDAQGKAVKYYVKNSYPNYFYEADAEKLLPTIWEMTTIANLE